MGMLDLLAALRDGPARAGPSLLAKSQRLQVRFAGGRGGEGPLTVGQRNTWAWVGDRATYTRMTGWALDLPAEVGVDDIAAAVSVLLARHESLRTTYHAGGQLQRVARSGEFSIEVCETAGGAPDPAALAIALITRLRSREFDLAAQFPLRVAVATRGGVPQAAVVVYSHMAVDFASMAIIGGQFSQLVADPASREIGPPRHQPLDQAAAEQSGRGRHRAQDAVRKMRARLRDMPQCLWAIPAGEPDTADGPVAGWLWSRAAAQALPHIAARTSASSQSAVLAALCALLALRTGHDRLAMTMPAHNRHQRHLGDYVGVLAGESILCVDAGVRTFDELVRRAGLAVLKASRTGAADRAAVAAAVSEIEHERGITYTRDCVYNDISGHVAAGAGRAAAPADLAGITVALADSELCWAAPAEIDELLLLVLAGVEQELVLGAITKDTRQVPRAEIESLLRGVELLLTATAAGDIELCQVGAITGVRPVCRDARWLRAGACWIELPEVDRLVRDATGVPGQVFALPGPDGEPALTAYLAAAPAIRSPEQAHAACLSLLPRYGRPLPPGGARYTAITPGRYVICEDPPGDRSDLAAWQCQKVLAAGDGRRRFPPAQADQPFR